MKYLLREKMWALGNDFVIKDEDQEPIYVGPI